MDKLQLSYSGISVILRVNQKLYYVLRSTKKHFHGLMCVCWVRETTFTPEIRFCEWETLRRRKKDEGKKGDEERKRAKGHPFISVPGQLLPGNSEGIKIILKDCWVWPWILHNAIQCIEPQNTVQHRQHSILCCVWYCNIQYIATVVDCSVKHNIQ